MAYTRVIFSPAHGPTKSVDLDTQHVSGSVLLLVCPYCRLEPPSCHVYTQYALRFRCFNPRCHTRSGTVHTQPLVRLDVLEGIALARPGVHVGYATVSRNGRSHA